MADNDGAAGGAEADPPPSMEVDLDETVELDDGLDLDNWGHKDREGGSGAGSLWATASAQLRHPSVGLVIGAAYHLVALAVYARPLFRLRYLLTLRLQHNLLRVRHAHHQARVLRRCGAPDELPRRGGGGHVADLAVLDDVPPHTYSCPC